VSSQSFFSSQNADEIEELGIAHLPAEVKPFNAEGHHF
jgi:hypothetical protein